MKILTYTNQCVRAGELVRVPNKQWLDAEEAAESQDVYVVEGNPADLLEYAETLAARSDTYSRTLAETIRSEVL